MKNVTTGVGLLVLRVLMGVGIAYHGYGKIWGGRMPGFTDTVEAMGFPLPVVFAWLAAFSEFLGGALIALGLGTRVAALFVFGTMGVAAFVRHAAGPFGAQELALAYGTVALALMLTGAGPYSLDRVIRRG